MGKGTESAQGQPGLHSGVKQSEVLAQKTKNTFKNTMLYPLEMEFQVFFMLPDLGANSLIMKE